MPLKNPEHQALIDILEDGLANIHRHLVRVIVTLAEIEAKGVYCELGYTSMWDFCIKRYKMTRDETFARLTAARLVQNYPRLLGPLESGAVTMTNLGLVRNLITEENVDAVVALTAHRTKEEVKDLVDAMSPEGPKAPDESSLKKLRQPSESGGLPRPIGREELERLSSDRYQLLLLIDRAFADEIEEARDLMRHSIPSGDLVELTREAYRELVKQRKKRKFGATDNPAENPRPSKDPTYVTAATRREVVARDGLRCAFVGAEGHRCDARGNLEFDHVQLRARGGPGTTDNVRLLCRAHNLHVAKQALGEDFVADKIAAATKARAAKANAKAEGTGSAVEDQAQQPQQAEQPKQAQQPQQAEQSQEAEQPQQPQESSESAAAVLNQPEATPPTTKSKHEQPAVGADDADAPARTPEVGRGPDVVAKRARKRRESVQTNSKTKSKEPKPRVKMPRDGP